MRTLLAALSMRRKPLRLLLANAGKPIGFLGFIAVVVLLGFRIKTELEKADQTRCVGNMRQIGLSLYEYREKFGGKNPQDIMALEFSGISPILTELLNVRNGKGHWTYFPEQTKNAEPLLVSPEIGRKKAILYPDMGVRLKPVAVAEMEINQSSTPGVKFWTPKKAPTSK